MKKCAKCKTYKELAEFNKNASQPDGKQIYCRGCEKVRKTAYYQANVAKFVGYSKKRKSKKHDEFEEYKKTLKCKTCGDPRWYLLDFHHRDRNEKDFGIATMSSGRASDELLKAELAKCDVLCANCHREFHHFEKLQAL